MGRLARVAAVPAGLLRRQILGGDLGVGKGVGEVAAGFGAMAAGVGKGFGEAAAGGGKGFGKKAAGFLAMPSAMAAGRGQGDSRSD